MSESSPQYSEDIYYYFRKDKKGKEKKIRVRTAETGRDNYKYTFMRVRDGYTYLAKDITNLIKE